MHPILGEQSVESLQFSSHGPHLAYEIDVYSVDYGLSQSDIHISLL